jgi:hypothetical protein
LSPESHKPGISDEITEITRHAEAGWLACNFVFFFKIFSAIDKKRVIRGAESKGKSTRNRQNCKITKQAQNKQASVISNSDGCKRCRERQRKQAMPKGKCPMPYD